jgi:hypothetical protein
MSQKSDLKALAQRAYLSYHQDGLIDLLIGWMAFIFGLSLSFDAPAISLLAWLPLLSYVPIKNALTVPRLGYVQFSPEYGPRQRKRLGTILAGVLGLLVLIIALLVLAAPKALAAVGDNGIVNYGAVVAILLLLAGLLSRIRRLTAYGLLCVFLAVAGATAGLPDYMLFIVLGLVIMLVGAILLVRFIRKYPPAQEGIDHDPA